jgi:hypothetical protein
MKNDLIQQINRLRWEADLNFRGSRSIRATSQAKGEMIALDKVKSLVINYLNKENINQ